MSQSKSKNINSSTRITGQTKINHLLKLWPNGTVAVQTWLSSQEISRQLAVRYIQGKWISKIGVGAYIKDGDTVEWLGGVYTLQAQLDFKVHAAGLTALELRGHSHYIALGEGNLKWLSKHRSDKRPLPVWFCDYFEQDNISCIEQGLFDGDWDKELIEHNLGNYRIKVSCAERAILEFLHFDPQGTSIDHAFQLMEQLTFLRPQIMQALLESCQSVKVKRLFLAVAEHFNYPWFERLNIEKIDLGKGKRVIGKGGYYNSKYQISFDLQDRFTWLKYDEAP